MPGVLDGYRVLDFGTAYAGPIAGHLLADMGAEVIKVESRTRLDGLRLGRPIVGDDIAGGDQGKWPDLMPHFHTLNRNKLGITVDLKKPEGVVVVKKLVQKSDIIIENFSPGVMLRAGLDYDSLTAVKPDIIMVSMSGPGQDGPLKDVVSYGVTISALSGLGRTIGYRGDRPLMTQVPFCDIMSGMHGAFAAMTALWYRISTGQGQFIDLSEWEASSSVLGEAMMDYVMNSRNRDTQGNYHPHMAPYNNYPCQGEDKWVAIAVGSEEEWLGFCKALRNPPWTKEARFASQDARLANRDALDELVSQWTAKHTPYEVMDLLQKAGVAAVPTMNIEDQYMDPHLRERQVHVEIEHPAVGIEMIYGMPWKLSDTPGSVQRHAPLLGEHNDYVLGEIIGLSKDEIAKLKESGVLD